MNDRRADKKTPSVCGLRSVHFGVADVDQSVGFFTRVWGLAQVSDAGGSAYLGATGTAPYVVALHKRNRTELLRVDFNAPERAAIEPIRARLAAMGADDLTKSGQIAEYGGGYGFGARDLDGLLFLIVADDERRAASVDAIDLPRKLSHLVLNTPDSAVIERFFIEGLGFRLIDRTRRMGFFNCNSDHHSVAIVPSDRKALHHVAFEMPSFDALMRGVGRLRGERTNVGWGVGRHGPGNNIFAYFVGPDGLPLEYTAEVQQVDETYKVGLPGDWKPTPGRKDQWGATGDPTQEMNHAQESIRFSDELLLRQAG